MQQNRDIMYFQGNPLAFPLCLPSCSTVDFNQCAPAPGSVYPIAYYPSPQQLIHSSNNSTPCSNCTIGSIGSPTTAFDSMRKKSTENSEKSANLTKKPLLHSIARILGEELGDVVVLPKTNPILIDLSSDNDEKSTPEISRKRKIGFEKPASKRQKKLEKNAEPKTPEAVVESVRHNKNDRTNGSPIECPPESPTMLTESLTTSPISHNTPRPKILLGKHKGTRIVLKMMACK